MAAGLPGFGLSGVFFVVSALLMLPLELVSTLRGRNSLARWGDVLRNAGIALAILAGLELTYVGLRLAVRGLSGSVTAHAGIAQSGARAANVVHSIPVLPLFGTLGLVAIVTASAKAAGIVSDVRRRRRDLVNAQSSGRHAAAHVLEHERFANELQASLGFANGRSR